jgi:hypothetical protein
VSDARDKEVSMQFSRYLRAPTMLLLLSALCFSAQGQRATVTSVSNEPLTGESLGPQIPGDLTSVTTSQSESQGQGDGPTVIL